MLRKFSLLTCLTAFATLFEQSNAEPCVNPAYEDIYTCTDPEVMLADLTIQCDPATCLWNLNAFNPGQPPEPCAAILLLEQQIADLPDLLEPCLWWEMLYGDLGYLLPQPAVVVPSPNPSPLGDLSMAPTLVESDTPSVDYTVGPSYSLLDTYPPSSIAVDKDVTPSPSRVGKLSIPLQSMLLTFVFERYSGFRLRRRLNENSLLATDESRDALMKVTREHLMANIPQVVDADLTMSRVDSSDENMETLLLMGTLYFAAEAAAEDRLPDLSPTSVRRQVEDVFDDNDSVLRFIHALRETDQAAFQDIVLVYPGIVSPDSDLQSTSNDEEESFWESFFFNWQNPVWIVVAAGISAALLGLCAVLGVTCYVRAERRKELAHHQLATRKSDDTSKTAGDRNLYNVEESLHEDDISMNGQSEIGYQESEVTSVYSYLDNNNTMLDDQSFSVAPSYTFPGPEYDDNRSVMWSVIHDAKKNDILDDLDSIAGVSLATRQTTAGNRSVVRERQLSVDSDDDVFSLLSQNGGPSPSETKRKSATPTLQDNPASSEKAAAHGAASKTSPESISGASQASRESLSKLSKLVTGFRSKNSSSTKVSPKNYQQLDDSDGSHHSWDKELGIQPSPDDLDEDSVFMDDSEEDETVASHLAPLSSIQRISSGGVNDDSDASSDENADAPNDDNNSVGSSASHGQEVEPAQFVVPNSDTIDTGYLATYSEDTTHSDGKKSTSSEKENISSETALDGDLNNVENTSDEAQNGTETNSDNPEQERPDELSAPPLTEKIECSDNIQISDSDTGNSSTELAEKEKIDLDQLPKEHSPEEEAPVVLNDTKPPDLVVEDDVPAIYTLASF
ncbi:hypothetical protein FisN_14Hh252 [Fistulifera solaris]|uniref:Uncharacterized protein n=1 Tax=Fistulifera solaris TaxID=1519565 RepID=A0A1Z5K8S9_FISSO|nr:hypothetical protein FisN_14Hh252 [Fistulifera solaris]|eukprot:GAX22616.1 hypothetical protein FisN_14Hh252 [Fistulifera solaris]